MNFFILMLSFLTFFSTNSFACSEDGTEGLLEKNSLRIPADQLVPTGISQESFHKVIDSIVELYQADAKEEGRVIEAQKDWESAIVNAFATRADGKMIIGMHGGLARHPAITEEGFALVVCHELGHHFGGAPKKTFFIFRTFASNEGQSDYFATHRCLKRYFAKNPLKEKKIKVDPFLEATCAKQFSDEKQKEFCLRSSMAGFSVASLFHQLRKERNLPSFKTPDSKVVTTTDHGHPATQCRLDTYFQGALCKVDPSVKVSNSDPKPGNCYPEAAGTVAIGERPLCWFKP